MRGPERRAQLLSVARRVFGRSGFHGVTMGADDVFRSKVQGVRDRIRAEVSDLIVRESRGRVDREDSDTVALALVGMVETVARRDPGGLKESRRRTVDTLVRLAWRGITR